MSDYLERKHFLLPRKELDSWLDVDTVMCFNCGKQGIHPRNRAYYTADIPDGNGTYHIVRYICRKCGCLYAEEELTRKEKNTSSLDELMRRS